MGRYRVWSDSDSKVEFEMETDDVAAAWETARKFVHKYDGKKYRVIVHIEDTALDETVDTYENINPCDCMYKSLYGGE